MALVDEDLCQKDVYLPLPILREVMEEAVVGALKSSLSCQILTFPNERLAAERCLRDWPEVSVKTVIIRRVCLDLVRV
jgi:hypothetical protein